MFRLRCCHRRIGTLLPHVNLIIQLKYTEICFLETLLHALNSLNSSRKYHYPVPGFFKRHWPGFFERHWLGRP